LSSPTYEESIRHFLISTLFARLGEPGSLRGEGSTAQFLLKKELGAGDGRANATLSAPLPKGGTLNHVFDLVIQSKGGELLAIDLLWVVNELDAIKSRAYDVQLLKQALGAKLTSIMIYLCPTGGGVSGEQAREICFPYDQFFAIEHQDPQNPAAWVPILDVIATRMVTP